MHYKRDVTCIFYVLYIIMYNTDVSAYRVKLNEIELEFRALLFD